MTNIRLTQSVSHPSVRPSFRPRFFPRRFFPVPWTSQPRANAIGKKNETTIPFHETRNVSTILCDRQTERTFPMPPRWPTTTSTSTTLTSMTWLPHHDSHFPVAKSFFFGLLSFSKSGKRFPRCGHDVRCPANFRIAFLLPYCNATARHLPKLVFPLVVVGGVSSAKLAEFLKRNAPSMSFVFRGSEGRTFRCFRA